METCNFCNKTFKNKYNLKVHIETAKSCLKIQNKTLDNKFTCSVCNKSYTRNYDLKKHKCKPHNTIINNTTNNITNNNTTNNTTNNTNITNIKVKIIQEMSPLDLSENNIKDIVHREFTKEYLKRDHEGVAQFIIDKILKRDSEGNYNYISVDGSRHLGVYKDVETGTIVKDSKYMKLANPVYSQACKKAFVLTEELTNEENKNTIEEENFYDHSEIISAMQLISKYSEPHPRFKNYIANKTAIGYLIQHK